MLIFRSFGTTYRPIMFSALLLVGAATVDARAANLTLRAAVQQTLNGNPLIRAAEANRRATDHELRQAQSRRLPIVDLNADVGGEKIDRPRGFSPTVNNTWRTRRQISVSMRQVLFDGWEISNAIYRNAARVDGAALRALSRSEVLALSAIEAYIDVYRQRRVLSVARRNVTRHRRYLRQVRAKKSAGTSSIGEVQQIRERLTAAKSSLLRVQQSLADASSKFNRVVGIWPGPLAPPPVPRQIPSSRQYAIDLGVQNNPAIRAAQADIEAAQFAAAGSRSSYYPKVAAEVRGAHGKNLGGTPGRSTDLSGRVVVNWRLFSGGAKAARANELAERTAEAMALRDARVRDITDQIDRSIAAIQLGGQRVRTAREQASIASSVVRTYEEEFKLSKRSLLDLLDSENARFNADIQLIGSRSLLAFAKYRILGATGTLIEKLGVTASDDTIPDARERLHTRHRFFSTDLPPLTK